MAKEKKENKQKEEKKEEKKEVLSIAKVFQTEAVKGAKNREDLANNIISYLASKGVTVNVKGKEITKARVQQQISAMIRDIKQERGKEKGSWWSTFNVVETETQLKLVSKA